VGKRGQKATKAQKVPSAHTHSLRVKKGGELKKYRSNTKTKEVRKREKRDGREESALLKKMIWSRGLNILRKNGRKGGDEND